MPPGYGAPINPNKEVIMQRYKLAKKEFHASIANIALNLLAAMLGWFTLIWFIVEAIENG